jgi:hypothetical protein
MFSTFIEGITLLMRHYSSYCSDLEKIFVEKSSSLPSGFFYPMNISRKLDPKQMINKDIENLIG